MTLSVQAASLPGSMSQSTTMRPSPTSRKPVALSRNDPFSMPVIHCLGLCLGMTASSLSVTILMARSSSMTRPHAAPFACWASDAGPASPTRSPTDRGSKRAARTVLIACPRVDQPGGGCYLSGSLWTAPHAFFVFVARFVTFPPRPRRAEAPLGAGLLHPVLQPDDARLAVHFVLD